MPTSYGGYASTPARWASPRRLGARCALEHLKWLSIHVSSEAKSSYVYIHTHIYIYFIVKNYRYRLRSIRHEQT